MLIGRMLGLALACAIIAGPAAAQDWPNRPVRIIVPIGPGGGTDIATRLLADPLGELLGQRFVVENKPGAGTTLGSNFVAKADKDGYTALMMSNAHAVSGAIYKSLPYDPVKDFQMISQVGTASLVLVTSPGFAPKDLKSVIAEVKANPGKYNFASPGVGTTQHLAAELFRDVAGVDITHVPYRTTPAALIAMRSNEVQMMFELVPAMRGQIESGAVRAIAVTSTARDPALPDVPTVAEAGQPGYEVTSWYGVNVPTGTPAPIVEKFNKGMVEVLGRPEVAKKILETGIVVKTSSPEELEKHVAREIAKWKGVIEKAKIPLQ